MTDTTNSGIEYVQCPSILYLKTDGGQITRLIVTVWEPRCEAQRRAMDEWVKLGLPRARVEEIVQQVESEARAEQR